MWNWIWVLPTGSNRDEGSTLSDEKGNSSHHDEHPDPRPDGKTSQNSLNAQRTHCVTFKRIGTTKEQHSQRILADVGQGETVEMILRPDCF